jgi:hypothetical protein
MAKQEVKLPEGKNPDGVNVEAKEMLAKAVGKKIKFTDRKTIELLKDTTYQKKGKVYSTSTTKADW